MNFQQVEPCPDPCSAAESVPHFREQERVDPVEPTAQIPDQTYGHALDYLVIACVDVVFTCANQVLLVKRNRHPRPSWWIIGGRMAAGEDPRAAARRKALQEAKLGSLDLARFRYVGVYSTCFASRHQAPVHHGSHTLNLTYQVELSLAEQAKIQLRDDEHATWKWLKYSQVGNLLSSADVMDRALLQVMQDLVMR